MTRSETRSDRAPTLQIKNLSVRYPLGKRLFARTPMINVLQGVSFDIPYGSFFGLVGESGCGKSTLGRATLNAAPVTGGSVTFTDHDGRQFDVGALQGRQLKAFRRRAQLIFQDPYAALSPRMTVRDIIAEPLEIMGLTSSRAETDDRVRDIAAKCRLNLEHLRRFPHAFSGGQRQRISIARALVMEPDYIIADESIAALDVSIQADILNLLRALQRDLNLTILFISHDLSVVAHICEMVAVMYLGRIVELAPPKELFSHPRHPYSQALIAAIPKRDPRRRAKRAPLQGEIPSPVEPPSGCKFHTRCPIATGLCRESEPTLKGLPNGNRVACHFPSDVKTGLFAEHV